MPNGCDALNCGYIDQWLTREISFFNPKYEPIRSKFSRHRGTDVGNGPKVGFLS